MTGTPMLVATWAARGLFKGAALVGAFVLIIALWLWDASLLTRLCGRSASPTGYAFDHIPTGTTAKHRVDVDKGEGSSDVMTVAPASRDRSRY